MDEFIPTRVSQLKKEAVKNFVTVSYEAPKKKPKREVPENKKSEEIQGSSYQLEKNKEDSKIDPRRQQELEMKRARYDIIKFGMSGLQKAKSKRVKVDLAISLGAKPPRNRRVNYKTLKDRRARKKENEKEHEHVSGLGKSLVKHKHKKIRNKDSGDILRVYGKVERRTLSRSKS